MNDESMHHIIRLKRYEQPPEGYYENFLREFHHRQRAEFLKPPLTTMLMERISSFLSEFRVPAFAYAGATAIAVLAGVAILKQAPQSTPTISYTASYSQPPVTIDKLQPVSLRIGTPDQPQPPLFPPSFLLQARPASHESPLSF